MQIIKNKNHLQRNFGSSLSENFSGDVIHSILSNPTDTLQALNESDLSEGDAGTGTVTLGEKVDRDVAGVVWIILHRDLIVDGVTRTYPNEIAAVDA